MRSSTAIRKEAGLFYGSFLRKGELFAYVVIFNLKDLKDSTYSPQRWSSNPSGKCSYERPTRGTVCGTMRSMCGADAGCLAINYQSLTPKQIDWLLAALLPLYLVSLAGSQFTADQDLFS